MHTQNLVCKDEVYSVVGAAMEVSREMGSGFLEAVYQEALEIEFAEREIPFFSQPKVEVLYKDKVLRRDYMPDFICFEKIIVEIKASKELTNLDQAQLLNYLKATRMPVGLLLNFGTAKLEWKRMVWNRS